MPGRRRGLMVVASLALIASLALASVGAFMEVSEAQRGPVEPPRVRLVSFLTARLDVEPVLILGNRSTLQLLEPNGTLTVPFKVLRLVHVEPRVRASGVNVDSSEPRLRLWLEVYGFRIPISSASGSLEFNMSRLYALAERAALEAGLGKPSEVRVIVEARVAAKLDKNGATEVASLRPSLVLVKRGALVTVESRPSSRVVTLSAAPAEDGSRAGLYLLAAGMAGIVASAALYAYARPRPLVSPERTVEGRIEGGIPVVEVASPRRVADLAEKLDTIVIDEGGRICVVDRGVAYCAPKPSAEEPAAGDGASPRGGGGEAQG